MSAVASGTLTIPGSGGGPVRTLPHPRNFVRLHEVRPGNVLTPDRMTVTARQNTGCHSESDFGTGECRALTASGQGAGLIVRKMRDADAVGRYARQVAVRFGGRVDIGTDLMGY